MVVAACNAKTILQDAAVIHNKNGRAFTSRYSRGNILGTGKTLLGLYLGIAVCTMDGGGKLRFLNHTANVANVSWILANFAPGMNKKRRLDSAWKNSVCIFVYCVQGLKRNIVVTQDLCFIAKLCYNRIGLYFY